jgi:chemotaxis protein MotA
MFVLLGIGILLGSVVMGYTMHGGKISVLMQLSEFIILGGAAVGSVIVAYSPKALGAIAKSAAGLMKGNPYKKPVFLELLQAMYEIFQVGRREGMIGLERHVEDPTGSDILSRYQSFLGMHHAIDLFADTMKLIIMGGVKLYDLSDMMDIDLATQHEEAMKISGIFTTLADAMPGFGIVAAVLGVVITMQSIGGPAALVGEKVAAALVGTFLGILLAYGVFAPIAKSLEIVVTCEGQYMSCIKNAVIAFARGDNPLVCVEFARRSIEPELRPSFKELEDACRGGGRSSGDTAKAA